MTDARKKKGARKKRKTAAASEDGADADQGPVRKHKKPKQRRNKQVSIGHRTNDTIESNESIVRPKKGTRRSHILLPP